MLCDCDTSWTPSQTIDRHVDYHSTAKPGDLSAHSRIIRLGRTIATGEASIFDANRKLVTSGRAAFPVGDEAAAKTS